MSCKHARVVDDNQTIFALSGNVEITDEINVVAFIVVLASIVLLLVLLKIHYL